MFKHLPDHLFLAILKKTPTIPLCRLRQTCWRMNLLAESQAEKLSARTNMGIDIGFHICPDNDERLVILTFHTKQHSYNPTLFTTLFPADYEKNFSGVAINHLKIYSSSEFHYETEEQLMNTLTKLQLTCDSIYLSNISFTSVLEILDLVKCREKIKIKCGENYSLEMPKFVFQELGKKPNTERMAIYSEDFSFSDQEIFDSLKPFGEVCFGFNNLLFKNMFKIISSSPTCGNLKKIRCVFWDWTVNVSGMPFDEQNCGNYPSHTILFAEGEDPFVNCDWFSPSVIRMMELPEKYAVIVEVQGVDRWNEDVYLVEKDPAAVLQTMTKAMKMNKLDDDIQSKYVAATEEKRVELFKEAFQAAVATRNFDQKILYD